MGRKCMRMRPVCLWSARVKEAVIMRISSDTLPRHATHFSDGTVFICHPCPPPWPRGAVSGLLKTRNQLNICVPGVSDKNPTFSTVRGTHGLSDTKPQVPHPVHRVGSTQVRKVKTKAHLEIDDLNARVA